MGQMDGAFQEYPLLEYKTKLYRLTNTTIKYKMQIKN